MEKFEKIFEMATTFHQKNKDLEETDFLSSEKEKEEPIFYEDVNYETDCYAKELLDIITNYDFEIVSYKKYRESYFSARYRSVLETYDCRFNGWTFTISHVEDDDNGKTFQLHDVIHKKNLESVQNQIHFLSWDLHEKKSSKEEIQTLISVLSSPSLQDYMDKAYEKYRNLPSLLEKKGYTVKPISYGFAFQEPQGFLQLEEGLYLKCYKAECTENMKFVVTNDSAWNEYCENDLYSDAAQHTKGYSFSYQSEEDIDELCKCIEAFRDEQKGHIGFYEDGTYYNTNDLISFFQEIESIHEDNEEAPAALGVLYSSHDWYSDEKRNVNKYTGLEVHFQVRLQFISQLPTMKDCYVNDSLVTFTYDKKIDPNACKLQIDNCIFKESNGSAVINEEKHEDEITHSIVENGSFSDLFGLVNDYVSHMCLLHEITPNFKEFEE